MSSPMRRQTYSRFRQPAASPAVVLTVLSIMLVSVTLLQRLALPLGNVPVALPIVLACVGYLILRGALAESPLRSGLYLAAVAACVTAAIFGAAAGHLGSLSSILLLVTLYAPFVFVLRPEYASLYGRVLDRFTGLVTIGAALAALQFALQKGGLGYLDPLGSLPENLLVSGYNTTYPFTYGSDILKSNGMIFLEPSFCSQFIALAAIVVLATGRKRWQLAVLGLGFLPTVSGTGVLLFAVGLILMSIGRGAVWTLGASAVLVFALVLVAATPAGKLFAERAKAELSNVQSSSFGLRFAAPYQRAYRDLGSSTSGALFGFGSGAVERDADAYFARTGLSIAYPVPTKILGEYGVAAAAIFLAFVLTSLLKATPSITIAGSIVFLYLTLSGSLLQPATVFLGLVLGSLFADPRRLGWRPLAEVVGGAAIRSRQPQGA